MFSWFDHPIPIYEGEINLKGLDKPVDVYFDKWAVPHVFAKNENDLFFAAGYLAARERLFQLSTVAFAVRGELASALGDQYLSIKAPLWDPSIVAGYERMMAHEMQGSWEPEIVYGAIASYFGEKKLSEIIPGYHKDKPTIVELDFKEFKPVFDLII